MILREGPQTELHFSSYSLRSKNDPKIKASYPYHSIKLSGIFVYGQDVGRNIEIFHVSRSLAAECVFYWIITIVLVFILWIGRRKLKLQRNGFSITYLDIFSALWAGGNIRAQHGFEKWFFGIVMIGAFFLIPILTGDLLDMFYSVLDSKVSTFSELTTTNLSIYMHPILKNHDENILEMIRLVFPPPKSLSPFWRFLIASEYLTVKLQAKV